MRYFRHLINQSKGRLAISNNKARINNTKHSSVGTAAAANVAIQNKFRWFSNNSNSSTNRNNRNNINHQEEGGKLNIPSNETVADIPNELSKKESVALKLDPRAIFPWRHSPHPLPRLIPNTQEFVAQGGYIGPHLPPLNGFTRSLAWINAAGFLGAKIVNYAGWKSDMEDSFQLAFAAGVQGVLHDVYTCTNLQKESDLDSERKLDSTDVDTDIDTDANIDAEKKTESDTSDADMSDQAPLSSQEPSFPISFEHSINRKDDYQLKQALPEGTCHHMLEPQLVSLYRSAHTCGKHKLQIKLRSNPKSATIQSLFVLPFLTRREVEDNVALKHSYRNIVKALHSRGSEKGRELNYIEIGNLVGEKLDDMSMAQMQRRERKKMNRDNDRDGNIMQVTVVAQVSIDCDEVFFVKDTETGDVVQGDAEGNTNDVTHLVRFEMVVDMNAETGEVHLGNWQITDWDDLLDGNMFFSDYHIL